jgi:hypothetical protein
MTKAQTIDLLYEYTVNKVNFIKLATQYPDESADTLKELAKRSGFNRKGQDCGAYKNLCEPAFPASEIKGLLGEYLDGSGRPDIPFREFLLCKGINADKGIRVEPKPLPQKAWHSTQAAAMQSVIAGQHEKEPLSTGVKVGIGVLAAIALVAVVVIILLFTRGCGVYL